MPLVTFDFHNTIASCDRWFQLEIARLAAEIYAALVPAHLPPERIVPEDELIRAYRTVRKEVIASGREKDALASVMATYAALDITIDPLAATGIIDRLMHEAATDIEPIAGVEAAIRTLHAQGCTLAVVSSAIYPPFLDWTLEAFGLRDAFQTVVTSASAGVYKSDPAIYRHAMELTGFSPHDAVHIGDSPRWDATTAKEAGMRTVLLASESADRYADARDLTPPDLTLETFVGAEGELVEFVFRATSVEVVR
ncbi:MAG: HAD family hydrolase [Thermomicrobiales bacterium]